MAFSVAMPWSDGEHRMHELLNVPEHDNPTSDFLTPQAAYASASFPLTAVGALDSQNRPWTSLWGGAAGFSQPLGSDLLGMRTVVDAKYDPVVQTLVQQKFGVEKQNGKGMMMGGLPIDLKTRRRMKLFGRVVAGAVQPYGGEEQGIGEIQLVTKIEQSLGNCPKYLNEKEIHEAPLHPQLISSSPQLSPEAISLIQKVDLFFLSTSNGDIDMDTNHRGGPPGFMRIISPGSATDSTPATIIYPEYSGNRLYQSLGNLLSTPTIGICVPDFDTGDVLYLTGSTQVLVADEAARLLPRTNLAVKITVIEARFVKEGLAFRGIIGDRSPYNPAVRLLASEGNIAGQFEQTPDCEATLIDKTDLTSTISRYRFRTSKPISYTPGQWVALDFSTELDIGYSHMRDGDPTSLNDDFVRTFTVSSHPKAVANNEFELTTRLHGPVTALLKRQRIARTPLEIPVKAFGGDFVISQDSETVTSFIAGGVGITPLLGQLDSLDTSRLRLIWTTRMDDIDFVLDTLSRHAGLAKATTVFVNGADKGAERYSSQVDAVKDAGAVVNLRRLTKDDLTGIETEKWYLCAGDPLRKHLLEWLKGKTVVFENFDY